MTLDELISVALDMQACGLGEEKIMLFTANAGIVPAVDIWFDSQNLLINDGERRRLAAGECL